MTDDKDFKDYIHRRLVPSGFRPQTDEEIEKTLDLFEEGPLDDDVVKRILSKSKGSVPLNAEKRDAPVAAVEETAESQELLALHRSEGESESEEIKEKLEKYRQEAREQDESEDEGPIEDVDGLED